MTSKPLMILSIVFFLGAVLFSFISKSSLYQTGPQLEESIQIGKDIYASYCLSCHMNTGEGIAGVYPPLAGADYLMQDKQRSIRLVMHGLSGEIEVNGQKYNNQMPDLNLSDEEVTHVLNYVRNSWGNQGEVVTFDEVKAVRAQSEKE